MSLELFVETLLLGLAGLRSEDRGFLPRSGRFQTLATLSRSLGYVGDNIVAGESACLHLASVSVVAAGTACRTLRALLRGLGHCKAVALRHICIVAAVEDALHAHGA